MKLTKEQLLKNIDLNKKKFSISEGEMLQLIERGRGEIRNVINSYIDKKENGWKHSIDASPFGIQRATQKRMIEELKELVK